MTDVTVYNSKPQQVRAMRIILGATTRTEIRQFCPSANVGVLVTDGVEQEKDIRWVYLPREITRQELVDDGDWLVELPDGVYAFFSDYEFNLIYERAGS